MIYKAIIEKNEYRDKLFEMFGLNMLIESLLNVEDSVRIAITELISSYLPKYFENNESGGYIDRILQNLAKTL
jgi:hypothetical protein